MRKATEIATPGMDRMSSRKDKESVSGIHEGKVTGNAITSARNEFNSWLSVKVVSIKQVARKIKI